MPNWTSNKIVICDDRDNVLEKIKGANGPIDFNTIIPMPDDIYRGDLGKEEWEKYGEKNWYDWSIENWGTKWNACNGVRCGDTIYFDTAWSGVESLIQRLSLECPNTEIHYWTAQEDPSEYAANMTFLNGDRIQYEECFGNKGIEMYAEMNECTVEELGYRYNVKGEIEWAD